MSENALSKMEPGPIQEMARAGLSREQVDLIKRTVARGTTDDELKLFLYTAARTGLDPLAKQLHAVKRWNAKEQREVMSIQTGIDGYRLIAERTNQYAPGQEPKYETGPDGKLISSTAFVKKLVAGTWHEVAATAFWVEYVQTARDGSPTSMWQRMPRLMLGKCAEALALRRAFPAEMSGVYTFEEMEQAENAEPALAPAATVVPAAVVSRDRPAPPPVPAGRAPEGNKFPCPDCGKPAGPSKFPKATASHYCYGCKLGFVPGEELPDFAGEPEPGVEG